MNAAREIVFRPPYVGACPSYGEYYIGQRYAGRDIYGKEAYDSALFRKTPFRLVKKCRTRKQAYQYVAQETGLCWYWGKNRREMPPDTYDNREFAGVIREETCWKVIKRTNEVMTKPLHDEQLTPWFEKYADCLREAKELVATLEKGKNSTEQLSLFGFPAGEKQADGWEADNHA